MSSKKTTEQHAAEVKALGVLILKGEYKGAHIKTTYYCAKHDFTGEALPTNVLKGQGLKCCGREKLQEKADKKKKKAEEAYKVKLAKQGLFELLEKYQGINVAVLHRCLLHGESHKATPGYLRKQGAGLACCRRHKLSGPRSTTEQHAAAVKKLGRVELIGNFKGTFHKSLYRCLEHGEEHEADPSQILAGHGLKCCLNEARKKHADEVKAKAAERYDDAIALHGKVERIDPYIGSTERIRHRCIKHRKIGLLAPKKALIGQGLKCCLNEFRAEWAKHWGEMNGAPYERVSNALLHDPQITGNAWLYLFESPIACINKFGISRNLIQRARQGGYGKMLIEPRFYANRREALMIEQAYKYGYSCKPPKELADWKGRTELTNQNPEDFAATIEELEEALYKLGEWAFAEDYCDPMEVQRAKQNSSI